MSKEVEHWNNSDKLTRKQRGQLFFYDVVEFLCDIIPYGQKIENFVYGQRELKFEFNDSVGNTNQITRLFFPNKFSQKQWSELIKSSIGQQKNYTMKEISRAHLDLLLDWDNYRKEPQGMDYFMGKYNLKSTLNTSALSISPPK